MLGLVSEERSTWKPAHVRAEAERQLRAHPLAVGADRDGAVDEVQRLVLGPGGMSVRLTMDPLEPLPAELVRSNGESVFRVHGQVLYTSEAVLAAEARLVAAGRETVPYSAAVPAELLTGLTAGQADLVQHFAGVRHPARGGCRGRGCREIVRDGPARSGVEGQRPQGDRPRAER